MVGLAYQTARVWIKINTTFGTCIVRPSKHRTAIHLGRCGYRVFLLDIRMGDYKTPKLNMLNQFKAVAIFWYTNIQDDNTEGQVEDNLGFLGIVLALLNGHLEANNIPEIDWNPVISKGTATFERLCNAHDLKIGYGKGEYFVEEEEVLRTKYEAYITQFRKYVDEQVDSEDEEDDDDED
jgi:hypothetical protein